MSPTGTFGAKSPKSLGGFRSPLAQVAIINCSPLWLKICHWHIFLTRRALYAREPLHHRTPFVGADALIRPKTACTRQGKPAADIAPLQGASICASPSICAPHSICASREMGAIAYRVRETNISNLPQANISIAALRRISTIP